MSEIIILKLAKNVTANGGTAVDEYTPANGKTVIIMDYVSSVDHGKDAMVRLAWDVAGTDDTLWCGKIPMPVILGIEQTGADGTKKITLEAKNNESGESVWCSGWVRLRIK